MKSSQKTKNQKTKKSKSQKNGIMKDVQMQRTNEIIV
jgi:hypothetical protein